MEKVRAADGHDAGRLAGLGKKVRAADAHDAGRLVELGKKVRQVRAAMLMMLAVWRGLGKK